jgi:hypothetical protein
MVARWIARLVGGWSARRRARRDLDQRLAAWRALPPDERAGYVHPVSPRKPPGWSTERYIGTRRRRDDAN